jgi:hypothetical protein
MTPENNVDKQYFKHFESPLIPSVTWQEMVDEKKVIAPKLLADILYDARVFLSTEPGPNLQRRREMVVTWFDYWQQMLLDKPKVPKHLLLQDGFVRAEEGIMKIENVAGHVGLYVTSWSGALFLGGGEGHRGHWWAAKYMADTMGDHCLSVWCFEQESFLEENKVRGGSFLPLPVRLSMWAHHPEVNIVTVLPQKECGVGTSDHYDEQFRLLGVNYFFVTEDDPYLEEKKKRGQQGEIDNVIPKLAVASTTQRVERFVPYNEAEEVTGETIMRPQIVYYQDAMGFRDSFFVP